MILQKISYHVKRFFGVAPHQKLLVELTDQASEIHTMDLKEELYAKIYDLVEHADARDRGDESHDEEVYQEKVDTMIKEIEHTLKIDPWVASVEPELIDVAKRLAPIYNFNDSGINSDLKYALFETACVVDKELSTSLSPFMGVQPMTGPVSHSHILVVEKTDDSEMMSMRIKAEVVSAKSCRLHTTFDVPSRDEQPMVKEMYDNALVETVVQEIFMDAMADLRAGVTDTIDSRVRSSLKVTAELYKHSHNIAEVTRRGPANFALVGSNVFSHLQDNLEEKDGFVEFPEYLNLKYVGHYHTMAIFLDSFAPENEAFIGYVGQTQPDAGFQYNPYVPIQSQGVILDPETGRLVERFINRGAQYMIEKTDETLAGGSDYYRRIHFTDLKHKSGN